MKKTQGERDGSVAGAAAMKRRTGTKEPARIKLLAAGSSCSGVGRNRAAAAAEAAALLVFFVLAKK